METHCVGDMRELYLLKKPHQNPGEQAGLQALLLFCSSCYPVMTLLSILAGYTFALTLCSYAHQKHHTTDEVKENRKRNSCMSNKMEAHKKTD